MMIGVLRSKFEALKGEIEQLKEEDKRWSEREDELVAIIDELQKENEELRKGEPSRTLKQVRADMAEIERLKKALEQAVGVACIRVESRVIGDERIFTYGDGDIDNCYGTEISEAPELAKYLKESQND